MTETALKFGPQWLRDLAHGNSASPPVSPEAASGQEVSSVAETPPPPPKYKLAQYRYGREEMLALYSKELKMPECLKEFDFLMSEKNQLPLALVPVSDEEQRIWARSVNSDVALRGSGKTPPGPGNGVMRTSRGGSVDRGRGRGRGGYYQRGISFEEGDDGQPNSFSRLKIERSQSASEKDPGWEDRDRRFERTFAARGVDNSSNNLVKDVSRAPSDSWRKVDKDDDVGWRTASGRGGVDKFGARSSWRNHDRDRNRVEFDSKEKTLQGRDTIMNGPLKSKTSNSRQRTSSSSNFWDDDSPNDNLPEWSVEETAVTDAVGTFDSSGAFMETKELNNSLQSEDVYMSDEEDTTKRKEASSKMTAATPPDKGMKNGSGPVSSCVPPIAAPCARKSNVPESLPKHIEKQKTVPVIEKKLSEEHKMSISPPRQEKPPNVICSVENKTSRTACDNEAKQEAVVSHVMDSLMSDLSIQSAAEDDTFAHHKKATENMMAQWTAEEEQRVVSETVAKTAVLDPHHEDAHKWFYRDPQGEIQGPFLSTEMLEWFKAGYFTMNLLVRRGCDERFMQLGELIQLWNRIPFSPGKSPPPLRVTPAASIAAPVPASKPVLPSQSSSSQTPSQISQPDAQLRMMQQQQQILQQLMQQHLLMRQAHVQQLISQLKQQDAFSNLNSQQQSQVVKHLLQQQQQQQVPRPGGFPESPVPTLPFPLMGLTVPSLAKNDLSMWSIPPSTSTPAAWPVGQSSSHPTGGIWDTDTPATAPINASELEKQFAEEEEKRRQALETAKRNEEEQKRREEELRRKEEEERLKELQRHKEEEERRLQELQRLKEEERRRQEEIRRLEELRLEQERKLEELRIQEEECRLEEQRKREEQKRLAELEEQRRLAEEEELRRLETQKKEEQRKKEEQKRLKELKKQEEKKRQEELQAKEREEERLKMERQKEAQRQKEQELKAQREAEIELELQTRREREAQAKKEAELCEMQEQKGAAWNVQNLDKSSNELSLSDIQKLQEKEREEKEKIRQQQQHLLMQQQQQNLKQAQTNKNGLSWAKRSSNTVGAVKSLAEIQLEEAERMAQEYKPPKTAASTLSAKVQQPPPTGGSVWGSSSQIIRSSSSSSSSSSAPGWNAGGCFWDNAVKTTSAQKPTKSTDSAFPALNNSIKPASTNSNKNKNVRAKKEQDAVLKIFETHRKPTDEFTGWCTEALKSLPSLVDVPTFVAFLKDVESPYEVHDYVRSYLGETKEAQEFSKQFLEKRSKYRNQSKQKMEENMWGPAPALTPSVNKTVAPSIADDVTSTKGKAKKKKNRMQKLDSSMLGFTVQPNPDRINVGEIDHVEGM